MTELTVVLLRTEHPTPRTGMRQRATQTMTAHTPSHVDCVFLWSRRAQELTHLEPQSQGWRNIPLSSPSVRQWLDHLLPKKLKPVGRVLVLPPDLRVTRERLRLDARLERFAERLRPFERLNVRDDAMPYTYDLENKFGDIRIQCRSGNDQVDAFSRRSKCQGI